MTSVSTEEREPATIEVTMPDTGSPTGARVIAWRRAPGDGVAAGEPLCVVAWDGNTAEIDSPAKGVLRMLAVGAGERAATGLALALIDVAVSVAEPEPEIEPEPEAEVTPEPEPEPEAEVAPEPEAEVEPEAEIDVTPEDEVDPGETAPELAPEPLVGPAAVLAEGERLLAASEAGPDAEAAGSGEVESSAGAADEAEPPGSAPEEVAERLLRDAPVEPVGAFDRRSFLSPAVRRFVREHDIDTGSLRGSGRGGRITLEDVRSAV